MDRMSQDAYEVTGPDGARVEFHGIVAKRATSEDADDSAVLHPQLPIAGEIDLQSGYTIDRRGQYAVRWRRSLNGRPIDAMEAARRKWSTSGGPGWTVTAECGEARFEVM